MNANVCRPLRLGSVLGKYLVFGCGVRQNTREGGGDLMHMVVCGHVFIWTAAVDTTLACHEFSFQTSLRECGGVHVFFLAVTCNDTTQWDKGSRRESVPEYEER